MTLLYNSSFLQRFHQKYLQKEGCWPWLMGADLDGYGAIKYRGVQMRAHRIMYEIHNGPIREGFVVMHSCDNPGCVNPQHLSEGTPRDNTQDMIRKGRKHLTLGSLAQQGIQNGKSKLAESQVREIRLRYASGEMQIDLASIFGVTQGAIHKIVARRTWKHI